MQQLQIPSRLPFSCCGNCCRIPCREQRCESRNLSGIGRQGLISPRLTCFGYTTTFPRARAELPSVILRSRYHACHAKSRLDDKKGKAQSLRAHVHSNLYTGRSNHRLSNFRFAQIYGISKCAIYPSFLWRY